MLANLGSLGTWHGFILPIPLSLWGWTGFKRKVGTALLTCSSLSILYLKGWRAQRQHLSEFSLWMHQELHSMRRANSEPQRHILERFADKVSKSSPVMYSTWTGFPLSSLINSSYLFFHCLFIWHFHREINVFICGSVSGCCPSGTFFLYVPYLLRS